MKIQTSELIGAALDWAVAKAQQKDAKIGRQIILGRYVIYVEAEGCETLAVQRVPYCPSSNWAHGGPLIDQFKLVVIPDGNEFFSGECKGFEMGGQLVWGGCLSVGPAALVTICRAVVACRMGDEVDVPDELVGGVA